MVNNKVDFRPGLSMHNLQNYRNHSPPVRNHEGKSAEEQLYDKPGNIVYLVRSTMETLSIFYPLKQNWPFVYLVHPTQSLLLDDSVLWT